MTKVKVTAFGILLMMWYSHYNYVIYVGDIFKYKLVFKNCNIFNFFYYVLSFLFFPEMSVFDVGSSNVVCNKSFQHSLNLHRMNFVRKWHTVCINNHY